MADEVAILVTTSSHDEAMKIAKVLVDEHLVACANVLPEVQSCFFWEGKTRQATEGLMICKSRLPLMDDIIERVKTLHSYTVPEIIALPIIGGLKSYLDWVRETVKE